MKTIRLPVKGVGHALALLMLGIGVSWGVKLAWLGPAGGAAFFEAGERMPPSTAVADAVRPLTLPLLRGPSPGPSTRASSPSRLRALLSATQAERDSDEQEELVARLVAEMTEPEIPGALSFLDQQPRSDSIAGLQTRLLCHWAATNPRAAATAVLETNLQNRQEVLDAVIGVWADAALADAIAWVSDLPDDQFKDSALLGVSYEAARAQPELAIELAGPVSPSPERDRLLAYAVAQWAAQAPEAAAAWATGIADAGLRERLQTAVAVAWGDSDPIDAATFAFQSMAPGKEQDRTLIGIVQHWAQKDPTSVAALLEMFPRGALRESALENLAKLWAVKDPKSAAAWLNTLPAGVERDAAVRAYTGIIQPQS